MDCKILETGIRVNIPENLFDACLDHCHLKLLMQVKLEKYVVRKTY